MAGVDWDKGLPVDVLALVAKARGVKKMKSMRGVSKTWQQGFELGVARIAIRKPEYPVLGSDAPLRFPFLTQIKLGMSAADAASLEALQGFLRLDRLYLGHSYSQIPVLPGALSCRLADSDLQHLRGMRLSALDLNLCKCLTDDGMKALRGLPLTSFRACGCTKVTAASLQNLRGMPLVTLSLGGCSVLISREALDPLRGMALTKLDLAAEYGALKGITFQKVHVLGWDFSLRIQKELP